MKVRITKNTSSVKTTCIKSAEAALPWASLGRGEGPEIHLAQTRNSPREHMQVYKYANTLNCFTIIPATGEPIENK